MSFPNCSFFKLANDYHVPRMDIMFDGHYGHLGPDGVRVWRVPLLKQAWKVNRLEPIMKLEVWLFKRRKFSFWNIAGLHQQQRSQRRRWMLVYEWYTHPQINANLGGGCKDFYVSPYLVKIPIFTNMFQRGWNHQPDIEADFGCDFQFWR